MSAITLAVGGLILMLAGCNGARTSLWVSGQVLDQTTGRPIAGAHVADDGYAGPPFRGVTTDSAGCYCYQTWCEEHNVSAQAAGYQAQRKTLTTDLLNRDTLRKLDFALVPE